MSRKGFCLAVIYGLGTLMASALGVPAAVYLFLPPRTRKESEWVEAGDVKSLELNQPQAMVFRRNRVDGWKITSEQASAWVVKISDQNVIAFSPWCTHLGCAYHWDQHRQEFLCPCHGSAFSLDGKVVAGPAPRPLDRYEVKIEGTELWLGPARKSAGTAA